MSRRGSNVSLGSGEKSRNASDHQGNAQDDGRFAPEYRVPHTTEGWLVERAALGLDVDRMELSERVLHNDYTSKLVFWFLGPMDAQHGPSRMLLWWVGRNEDGSADMTSTRLTKGSFGEVLNGDIFYCIRLHSRSSGDAVDLNTMHLEVRATESPKVYAILPAVHCS
eukprot:4881391-Pyramimonas_sp.AAC.2